MAQLHIMQRSRGSSFHVASRVQCQCSHGFYPASLLFVMGGLVWSPRICEGLCSSFVGCITDGKGEGQAGSRVTVRST